MTKIDLKQAKEILAKQGYEVELSWQEVLGTQWAYLDEDASTILLDETFNQPCEGTCILVKKVITKYISLIQRRFSKLFDNNDAVSDIFWNCIESVVIDLKKEKFEELTISDDLCKNVKLLKDILHNEKIRTSDYFSVVKYKKGTKVFETTPCDLETIGFIYMSLSDEDKKCHKLIFKSWDSELMAYIDVPLFWAEEDK